MSKENERPYNDEQTIAINDEAKLIIRSFWCYSDLCAHGFIKYDNQEEIKFGFIDTASPSDFFVPSYFKTTNNYVAICHPTHDGSFEVEEIFDVQKKRKLEIGLTERIQAIKNFKIEVFKASWDKLDNRDKEIIKQNYENPDNDETDCFRLMIKSIAKAMNTISDLECDSKEREDNIHEFLHSLLSLGFLKNEAKQLLIDCVINGNEKNNLILKHLI